MIKIATYSVGGKELERVMKDDFPNKKVLVRLGGSKAYDGFDIQLNKTKAVDNCINKLVSKELFIKNKVATLPLLEEKDVKFPVVIKGIVRSCGSSVFVVEDKDEMKVYKKILHNQFYIEPLFQATSEYRLHCTKDKVFFSVKKIKRDGHEGDVIVNAKNHYNVRDFVKPRLWEQIQKDCVKAMNALGLDIGAVDVGYNSKGDHSFVIHEINTGPELLENTIAAYRNEIKEIVNKQI